VKKGCKKSVKIHVPDNGQPKIGEVVLSRKQANWSDPCCLTRQWIKAVEDQGEIFINSPSYPNMSLINLHTFQSTMAGILITQGDVCHNPPVTGRVGPYPSNQEVHSDGMMAVCR